MVIIKYKVEIKNRGTLNGSVDASKLSTPDLYGLKCWILRNHYETENVVGTKSVEIIDWVIELED